MGLACFLWDDFGDEVEPQTPAVHSVHRRKQGVSNKLIKEQLVMIKGIGIDAVDLVRIKEIIEKKPRFAARVLTPDELAIFQQLPPKRQVEFLAGRYACKEAFAKAWGTGIGKVTFQELEILNDELGAPYVSQSPHQGQVFVSITHTDTVAVAQILLAE